MTGFIGTVAFVFLLIQSPSPVRHAFYEVFLHGHIVGAAIAVGGVWVHLDGRPQQLMMYGVVALWVFEVCIETNANPANANRNAANLPVCSPHYSKCRQWWH